MPRRNRNSARSRPTTAFIILAAFFAMLWIAGGASRADVLAQVVIRGVAAVALIVMVMSVDRVRLGEARFPWMIFGCAVALVIAQLIPLPYTLWSQLPGRAAVAAFTAGTKPWAALSLDPGMTFNALMSLLTPLVVLSGMTAIETSEQRLLLPVIVILVVLSALLGLFQFSVGYFDNPLLNDTPWQIDGTFANRNHYALLLAIGCLIVPATLADHGWRSPWWGALVPILLVLLLLLILATGSRAGALLGVLAALLGFALALPAIRYLMRGQRRWVVPAVIAGVALAMGAFIAVNLYSGRAASIDRLMAGDEENLRAIAFPTVTRMVAAYFPAGIGVGSFDAAFRIHEPFDFLRPTYFNHAHNDLIELVLESGLLGLALLTIGLGWWLKQSVHAWRARSGREALLPRLGSAMILLTSLASIVDYPARTPLIMALLTVGAVWLSGANRLTASALPAPQPNL